MDTPGSGSGIGRVIGGLVVVVLALRAAALAGSQELPVLDVVIGNNFGHLPMFVGVDTGLFSRPTSPASTAGL